MKRSNFTRVSGVVAALVMTSGVFAVAGHMHSSMHGTTAQGRVLDAGVSCSALETTLNGVANRGSACAHVG